MTSYKLLITDVDGTLLNSRHTVSQQNAQAIQQLMGEGYSFGLATGRIEMSAAPLAGALNVTLPLILYNGARVIDVRSGKILFESHLSGDAVRTALGLLSKLPVDVNLYSEGHLFVSERTPAVLEHERKERITALEVGDLLKFVRTRCPGPVTKLLIIGEEQSFAHIRASLDPHQHLGTRLVSSDAIYLEVLPEEASKGAALDVLCRHLDIPLHKVVAMGDAPNDLDMLTAAGLGVAVANAHPDIITAADYVAPSHDENAVAHVIERFFPTYCRS